MSGIQSSRRHWTPGPLWGDTDVRNSHPLHLVTVIGKRSTEDHCRDFVHIFSRLLGRLQPCRTNVYLAVAHIAITVLSISTDSDQSSWLQIKRPGLDSRR
jgi:hypothetical protein